MLCWRSWERDAYTIALVFLVFMQPCHFSERPLVSRGFTSFGNTATRSMSYHVGYMSSHKAGSNSFTDSHLTEMAILHHHFIGVVVIDHQVGFFMLLAHRSLHYNFCDSSLHSFEFFRLRSC